MKIVADVVQTFKNGLQVSLETGMEILANVLTIVEIVREAKQVDQRRTLRPPQDYQKGHYCIQHAKVWY